jgi:hypothetical protein
MRRRRGGEEEDYWSCLLLIHVSRLSRRGDEEEHIRRGDEQEEMSRSTSHAWPLSPPLSLSFQSPHPIS